MCRGVCSSLACFLSKSWLWLFSVWQLYPYSEDAGVLIGSRRQNGVVASLADIAWIDRDEEDDEDLFGRPRWEGDGDLLPNIL